MTKDEFLAEFDKQTAEYEHKIDAAYQRGCEAIIKKHSRRERIALWTAYGIILVGLVLLLLKGVL